MSSQGSSQAHEVADDSGGKRPARQTQPGVKSHPPKKFAPVGTRSAFGASSMGLKKQLLHAQKSNSSEKPSMHQVGLNTTTHGIFGSKRGVEAQAVSGHVYFQESIYATEPAQMGRSTLQGGSPGKRMAGGAPQIDQYQNPYKKRSPLSHSPGRKAQAFSHTELSSHNLYDCMQFTFAGISRDEIIQRSASEIIARIKKNMQAQSKNVHA